MKTLYVSGPMTGEPEFNFPVFNAAAKVLRGQIWRIERAGVGPANGHESETALDRWSFDRIISNNGPIAQLVPAIDLLLS